MPVCCFGPGWQLAADTTVSTGFGTARLDLTTASWDAQDINLRLETWGSIEVLVPEGVAIQLVGGSRPRPAPIAVPAHPRRPDIADLDIRTNRDDPNTPPRGQVILDRSFAGGGRRRNHLEESLTALVDAHQCR